MARLDIRTFIRATPERVWEIVADLPGQKNWMVDVRRMDVISEKKTGAGTVIEVTSELFGQPWVHDTMEIVGWDPPYRFDVVHRGQFSGTGAFILERVTSGTVFTWIEDFNPPLGMLGEIGFSLVVAPHLRSVFSRSLANLKRLAEHS